MCPMVFEQWLGYLISLWSNIVWQWCWIRRTLTQYSVSVATGQPDIQCNIVWQWCRIRWTLTEYLVGVATGQPYTHPILYGHCVGIGRHQQDILRAVVSDYMAYWWTNHSSKHSPTYSDQIHWTPMESSGFQWVPLDCCSYCGGSSSSSSSHCTVVVFVVDGVGIGRGWQNSKGSGVGLGRIIMVVDSPLPILVRLTRIHWNPWVWLAGVGECPLLWFFHQYLPNPIPPPVLFCPVSAYSNTIAN